MKDILEKASRIRLLILDVDGVLTDGSLFVFTKRRRDRMTILHFAEGGFWLYYRVLEAGTFETLRSPS